MNIFAQFGIAALVFAAGALTGWKYEHNAWQASEGRIAQEQGKLIAERLREAIDAGQTIASVLGAAANKIAEQKPARVERIKVVERANVENPQYAGTIVPPVIVGVWDQQAALSRDAEARARSIVGQ